MVPRFFYEDIPCKLLENQLTFATIAVIIYSNEADRQRKGDTKWTK